MKVFGDVKGIAEDKMLLIMSNRIMYVGLIGIWQKLFKYDYFVLD